MSQRTTKGQFTKGESGNPPGRPPGSRNRSTLLAEQFLEGECEKIVRKAVEHAKKGNILAMKLCLERVLPVRKERTIAIDLQPVRNVQDLNVAFQAIVSAVGDGRITPGEAHSLSEVLNVQSRVFGLVDVDRRIQELEGRLSEFHACERNLSRLLKEITDEGNEKA